MEARSVVLGLESCLESHLSFHLEFFRGTVATIGLSLAEKLLGSLLRKNRPLGLVVRPLIPIHSQTCHGVQDHL
jgi:hypothetical protein